MMDGSRERVTLSENELQACRPVAGEGGRSIRAFCPFHQSDHQRSLRVTVESGRFACFACGAWGYLDTNGHSFGHSTFEPRTATRTKNLPPTVAPARGDLPELFERYRDALPGSLGERYLRWRGIPFELARALGVGYAACGQWAHANPKTGQLLRQWKYGRLVFPHTDHEGRLVNLYGRAVGSDGVPKQLRHDHLPGSKGYFNASDLQNADAPVYICEGPFDAMSLLAAGISRVVAIFGIAGWRWEWGTVRIRVKS